MLCGFGGHLVGSFSHPFRFCIHILAPSCSGGASVFARYSFRIPWDKQVRGIRPGAFHIWGPLSPCIHHIHSTRQGTGRRQALDPFDWRWENSFWDS
jgi:hypothetical protein